jgi:hypothetical protein
MAKTLKSRGKKVAAQTRLRRIEEKLAPYRKYPTPQSRPPKSTWVPGDYTISRKGDAQEPHHCVVIE